METIIKKHIKEIKYKNDELNGIIKYLGSGDKVIKEGIMYFKASSE